MDPEKATINENVTGRPNFLRGSEATRVSGGKRSASDERRFQNALEDDEIREALRALRGYKP
jgi:hypothetical protein